MYSFASQKGCPNFRIIRVPELDMWRKYPYGQIVGTTRDPDPIRELFENDPSEYPPRLLAIEGKNVLLLQKSSQTLEYGVIMTLKDRVLAERLVFKKPSVQTFALDKEKTPSSI